MSPGKRSPQDRSTAVVLHEQPALPDPADTDDDGQEQQLVLSPERLAWLEELRRRIGALARETPKAKPRKRLDGTATPQRHPGYRPPRR
ncbi:hypothetical protein ACIQCJ_17095 [Streptomyces sp. NPDC093221]|uniref:hypothetical protein n=1 Tax=Streptomyces sp. NPDC093221 TaxID=3366032 RepID=UPI0037F8A42F